MYGNLAQGDPYESSGAARIRSRRMCFGWLAVDLKWTPGKKIRSHPAFYLPGQELAAGNMRGFWVVDACQKRRQFLRNGRRMLQRLLPPG